MITINKFMKFFILSVFASLVFLQNLIKTQGKDAMLFNGKYIYIIFFILIVHHGFCQCYHEGSSSTYEELNLATPSSGNNVIDRYFLSELSKIEKFMNIKVKLLFLDDEIVNASAYNIKEGGYDGIVVFHLKMIEDLEYTDFKIKMVLAHECAHIVQYKYGDIFKWSTVYVELFADLLSGAYLGISINDKSINEKNFFPAMKTQGKYGDYYFNDPDHHGTPQQRINAVSLGAWINSELFHRYYNVKPYKSFKEIYEIGMKLTQTDCIEFDYYDSNERFESCSKVALSCLHSAYINSIKVDHNVYLNGKYGMKIYANMDVYNCTFETCSLVAYFYFNNGVPLKDFNKNYATTDGYVSCSGAFQPRYANTNFSNFTMFMPYSELHLPNGENRLKFRVAVFSGNEQIGATTDDYPFEVRY